MTSSINSNNKNYLQENILPSSQIIIATLLCTSTLRHAESCGRYVEIRSIFLKLCEIVRKVTS